MPARPAGAVVTVPLGVLGQHFAALIDRAATLPGGDQVRDLRSGLAAQLGFDPFTRDGLLAAGLDPDRGAALALFEAQPRPEWVIALPLVKPDRFAQTLQRLMVERYGAAPGKDPQTFERGGSILAFRVVRGYGVVSRGLAPLPRLDPPGRTEESLARAPGLAAARKRLGAQDLVLWAPPGSALPRRYTDRALPGDVALSVQAAAQGLALRFVAQLPPEDAARARATLPGGGASLVELLPDAPLRARLGVAPAQLLALLRGDPRLAPLIDRLHGLDEVFASLAPGAALSVGLAKNASIAQAVDYGLDWRRKSPFDTVQLVALAGVADRARLAKALDGIAKQLPALGARAARSGDDFQITYAGGKGARFGVREIEGKLVAYLLGGEVAPQDLHRTPKAANPEGAALSEDAGAAARADFGKLAAQVHALPESTYGTGPQSYVTRSVVAQVIDPLRPLRLMVAVQAQPDSLGASLDVEIAAP